MPSLPGDAGGGAAGAQEDSQGSQPEAIVVSGQQAANHEDTPPEWYINNEVLLQTFILIIIRGLGNLLLLWSTVVLLGGFVSNLPNIDFVCITIICVLQSLRVFNALVDEQYRYLIEILLDRVKKYTKEKNSANTTAASGIHVTQLVKKLMSLIAWIFILIPFTITVFYPLTVFIVHIVLSSVRLRVYWHKSGDEAKMNKAILSFYILTLFQGVLYLLWYILDFGSYYWLVGETAKKCKFGDSWGKDSVRQYLANTKSRCLSNLAAERSLIMFASGLLDSDGKADFLSGARMVNTFIEEGKLPVQELIRSSRSRVQKLLMMLAWKQPDDRDIRFQAAKIVAHVAGDMDIAQFPGTLGCISSLIEPSKDNYSLYRSAQTSGDVITVENGEAKVGIMEKHTEEVDECDLILQGFSILDKLTLDKHNSIEILQDQALLTHIIAWVRSKPFIGHMDQGNHWPTILKSCLNVLVRLTSLPEQNASQLNHIIKVQIPIFISGYASKPELQAKGMEIFANVFYLDKDDKNRNTHQKRKKFLVVIRGLFLSCTRINGERGNNPNGALKDGVIARAGEALSMLSANEINCHTLYSLDTGITEQLDTIIFGGSLISVVYRSLAAEIDSHVYNNTILKTHVYDDVTSKEKKLHKVVGLLSQLSGAPDTPQGDNKAYFYRLQAALVYTIDVLINTVMVQDEGRQTVGAEEATEDKDRRKRNASLFKQKILDSFHGDFVQVLKRLIETDSNVATTGRLEVVKSTASLVRSMIGGRFLVENFKSYQIIESLKSANKVLSGVDSWEIFNSNQRRGLKWQSTLESLINDIQKLLNRAENTTPAVTNQ